MAEAAAYPARFSVDYPDRPLNRLTSFFRIFVIIPIYIVFISLIGVSFTWYSAPQPGGIHYQYATSAGILFMPLVLMILFRKKYPRWWFDWNLALTRFIFRISSYALLLRDEYPSTDEEQAIHLDMIYPDAKTQLGRGWPMIKWFLAIPHYFVLSVLAIVVLVCWVIVWVVILFSGRYPKGIFDFTVGVLRWSFRVEAYAFLLITDRYPPFSLQV